MAKKPNIVLILSDDMGYSDIGCYGGEIDTPNVDNLANNGLRFTQFYNTARCCPSRASLLTGLHPHQTGIGILVEDLSPEGYAGNLNRNCVTIAEVLKGAGYSTYMSGKWHVTCDLEEPSNWPLQRGFDEFYGTITGAGSYFEPNTLTRSNENIEHEAREEGFFYTDAISDNAVQFISEHATDEGDKPFFLYVAYTAPHWPLHALDEDIEKYRGRFDAGWDILREERLDRMVSMGIIEPSWKLTERDPSQPPWSEEENKAWQTRRMEVYAAQIDRMDKGIGRIVSRLKALDQLDNTMIIFLSDNGGCAEELWERSGPHLLKDGIAREFTREGQRVRFGNDPTVMPGGEDTYQSYGVAWANLSNTPFRLYKHWVHEGGISTPFIVHWPQGIEESGVLRHTPAQLPDVMATIVEIADCEYPTEYNGNAILPLEGSSLYPVFEKDTLDHRYMFWEHEGNAAVRYGNWKLVKRYPGHWELYNMNADRTELNDVSSQYPHTVRDLKREYERWAARCGVFDREDMIRLLKEKGYMGK